MTRQISTKNYVIFAGLVIFTILTVLYLGKWYKTTEEYLTSISPLASILRVITIEELDSYLLDNPDAVVYITDKDKTYNYEEELKKLVENYDLENLVVYLELSEEDYKQMENYYFNSKLEVSNLVIFENNKIKYFLAHDEKDLTKENTINFLKEHEVIEND